MARLDAAKEKLETATKDAAQDARAQLEGEAQTLKSEASARAEAYVDAADAARGELPEGSLADRAMAEVGNVAQQFATHLGQTSLRETADDIAIFAGRNPGLFLGAAALGGFALARFLKADHHSAERDASAHDPWNGHLSVEAGQ